MKTQQWVFLSLQEFRTSCDNSFLVLSPARNEFAHRRPKGRSWLSPWGTPSLGRLLQEFRKFRTSCDNSFLVLSPARNEFAHRRPKGRSWLSPWGTPSLG